MVNLTKKNNSNDNWLKFLKKDGFKIDLHSHTKFSNKPTNHLTKKIVNGESITEPIDAYKRAMDIGLSLYTATDHDTIEGNLYLLSKGIDVPISLEVTARFPNPKKKKRCKIHVLTYDLPKENAEIIFNEINKRRDNIFDLINYYDEKKILYMCAHPTYSVNDLLTFDKFEQLLLLFNHFELNGSKHRRTNQGVQEIINNITINTLEKLADKYHIDNPKICKKYANKCGQDAHILGTIDNTFVGRSFTFNPDAKSIDDLFNKENNKNIPIIQHSTPNTLTYVLYNIVRQFNLKGSSIEEYIALDKNLKEKYELFNGESISCNSFSKKTKYFFGKIIYGKNPFVNYLKEEYSKTHPIFFIVDSFRKAKLTEVIKNNPIENFMPFLHDVVLDATKEYIKNRNEYPKSTVFFNTFGTLGDIVDISKWLSIPAVSYKIFHETINFTEEAKKRYVNNSYDVNEQPRIAHIFDTFYEVNGPAKYAQGLIKTAKKFNLPYNILTCSNNQSTMGEVCIPSIYEYIPEEYSIQPIRFPDSYVLMEYIVNNRINNIHIATPGPLGLTAQIIGRILGIKTFATYHTRIPQYVYSLTGEYRIEDITWNFLKNHYDYVDSLYALCCDDLEDLEHHGIKATGILPRGIDTNRFFPDYSKKYNDGKLHIGTSCRISKDKNIHYAPLVIERILKKYKNVHFHFMGPGPKEYLNEFLLDIKTRGIEDYVTYHGSLEKEEYVSKLQSLDLFIFYSTEDTFGQTPLEAQNCGVPVIVTDEGGPKDYIIDGENGFIMKGNNIDDTVNTLIYAIENKDMLNHMGNLARKYAKDKNFDNSFLHLYKLYNK
jgi:glycosyltransferase involved in cell wall biosynthesis